MPSGLKEAFERIGEAAEHYLPLSHAAGLSLAVTDLEDVLGVVVRGFADVAAGLPIRPETRFEIGSISKSFAAIVCLQEVEAGRLDLNASINELLPWLEMPEPFGPITLHHLLTHTSGLPIGAEESPTGPGAIAILRKLGPTIPPGERYSYSNDAYKLVGMILERVGGLPIHDLLRERILAPLGMTSTDALITDDTRLDLAVGYEPVFDDRPPSVGHPLAPARWLVSNTADGSIVSNVLDMSVYARALLGRGVTSIGGREVRILAAAAFEELVAPRVAIDDEPRQPDARYGYGLWTYTRDGRRHVQHSGGMVGYTALLTLDVDAGLACVVMQNGGGDKSQLASFAIDATLAAVVGDPVPRPTAPPAPTAISNAAELSGTYMGDRTVRLVPTAEGLRLVDGPSGVELERWPDDDQAFLVLHPAWGRHLLRVTRNAEGAVVALTHGPARFVREGHELDPPAEHPPAWSAFPGVYRSNDPWSPVVRVYLRDGRLWLAWPAAGEELELTPVQDGDTFAVGGPSTPRRARFEEPLDGRASTFWYDGGRWYRSFED